MNKRRILVTGATGKTGSIVVSELLNAGHPVRAMVRKIDHRSRRLEELGAEIAVADITDVERVAEALKGVQGAYYCPPWDPHVLQGAAGFAVAAREAKLEHIVSITQWLASPSHPSLMTRQLWLIDRLFSMTPGVAHTIVNPGFFADAYLILLGFAAHLGVFPWMYGDSRNAPPSNEDVARVAAECLMDPERHAGKTYRPTGPDLLGASEMASVMASVLRRKVRVTPTPMWMFLRTARVLRMPIDLAAGIRYYVEDHRQHAFELGAPTDDVREVTGKDPENFETITRRYAELPANERSVRNTLRKLGQFVITPFSRPVDLDRYDRELRTRLPQHPQFAPESDIWRREHLAELSAAAPSLDGHSAEAVLSHT